MSFVFLALQPLVYLSMTIHEEFVVHAASAKHSSPCCAYRCWEVPGGDFPVTHTGVPGNVTRDLFPILDAWILCTPSPSSWGGIPVQLLCNIVLHTLLETDIFVSWNTKRILLLGPFIKFSLLYLKPDVQSTRLKSIVVTCTNIQRLWGAEDRRSLQIILLWLLPLLISSPPSHFT